MDRTIRHRADPAHPIRELQSSTRAVMSTAGLATSNLAYLDSGLVEIGITMNYTYQLSVVQYSIACRAIKLHRF